jgi:[ribosomal protein S18]-alanine N-acetyltransferase
LNIRNATAADIPILMALEASAITAAHWSGEQYQAIFSQTGACRLALVAEEASQVRGFLIAREVQREWEIENIVVADSMRRRGLGTRLLDGFLNLARAQGAKAVSLEVRESNLAARRLYQKQGFFESGRRKSYYRQPEEDAIAHRLQLP